MSDCPHCIQARGCVWHGGYRDGCDDCIARAIARSGCALRALHPNGGGDSEPLHNLIRLALPSVATTEARAMVHAWWERDWAQATQFPESAT